MRGLREPRNRGGYTLIEMLLVLAVLVAFAAIAWPAVARVYADYQLKDAVEDVRVRLASTRIRAIDASEPYQFCYEPEGQRFVVLTLEPPLAQDDETNSAASGPVSGRDDLKTFLGELPEELRFQGADGELTGGQRIPQDRFGDLPGATQLASLTWSLPIVFHPDGSATDAEFRIIDRERQFMRIAVRGLTGSVSTSSVEREER